MIVDYNATSKIGEFQTWMQNYLTDEPIITDNNFNISNGFAFFYISMTDLDINHYYEHYILYPIENSILYLNLTKVFEFMNNTVRWAAGDFTYLTLISNHYDLTTGIYSASLKFPAEQTCSIYSTDIMFHGQATLNLNAKINSENVLEYMKSDITMKLSSPANGNITITDSYHIIKERPSAGGFDLSGLLGQNSLVTIGIVGVVALVIGLAIGRKH